jgi:uncharacterized protein (DUF2267 family)
VDVERPNREVPRVHEHQFLNEVARMTALESEAAAERAVVVVFCALQNASGIWAEQRGMS